MATGIKHLRKVAQAAREFMKAADIGPDIAPVAYNEAREKLATSLGKLAEVEPPMEAWGIYLRRFCKPLNL